MFNSHKKLLDLKIWFTNLLIVDHFNSQLAPVDKSFGQKVKRETSELNDIVHQTYLIDMYRITIQMPDILLSSTWKLLKIDCMLGHKTLGDKNNSLFKNEWLKEEIKKI